MYYLAEICWEKTLSVLIPVSLKIVTVGGDKCVYWCDCGHVHAHTCTCTHMHTHAPSYM